MERTLIQAAAAALSSLAFVSLAAHGATYYVDGRIGSDTNNGLAATAGSAGQGPWRSLARVGAATLQPGDTVRLACGQKWSETLAIRNSGVAGNPIVVDSWPANCADKPAIDGSAAIPADEWRSGGGQVWEAAWPPNVLENGTFDSSTLSPWTSWSDGRTHLLSMSTDCPAGTGVCLRFSAGDARTRGLVISSRFALPASYDVQVRFAAKLPAGQTARAIVRRHGAPWDVVTAPFVITGTGNWEVHTFGFRPAEALPNARIDFELAPPSGPLLLDDVAVVPQLPAPTAVHLDDVAQTVAHHPNHGRPGKETSVFLPAGADSPSIPSTYGPVSNSLTIGTNLGIPAGARIRPGQGIRIRGRAWWIDERTITAASQGVLTLDTESRYNLLAGWGYFLTGDDWMLDSPSEWFMSTATSKLRLRSHDDQSPGARATVTYLATGADVRNQSYVTLRNLGITRVGHGIVATGTTGVVVDRVSVSKTQGYGVEFIASLGTEIRNSVFTDTRLDALAGTRIGSRPATFAIVTANRITGVGVPADPQATFFLPSTSVAAIHAGQTAVVERNRIERVAYVGIRAERNSTVRANHIQESCLVLDDGAAIYMRDPDHNGLVANNVIIGVRGNLNGKPNTDRQAVGIYMDDWTSGATVSGNTIIDADHGIQVHNAFRNTIEGNTLFGNRVNQIWMQENTKKLDPAGDIRENMVRGNLFVPLSPIASVYHSSEYAHPRRFASYQQNVYSALLSPLVSLETWNSSTLGWRTASYTFGQWNASTYSSVSRQLDLTGRAISPSSYAQYAIIGGSLLTGTAISDSPEGWRTWTASAPYATIAPATCPAGPCRQAVAGGSDSLLISPNFSIQKDQWYRLSFDLRTGAAGQEVGFLVRRGGGNGTENEFESVMGAKGTVVGNGTWTRYVHVFKATATVLKNDAATGDIGARVDFGWLRPGESVSVGKVDLVPISSVDESTQMRILVNSDPSPRSLACPDEATAPGNCAKYVTLESQTTIVWPYEVPPNGSKVIFTQDKTLLDTDADGIADGQDTCPGTPAGKGVDPSGCSLP